MARPLPILLGVPRGANLYTALAVNHHVWGCEERETIRRIYGFDLKRSARLASNWRSQAQCLFDGTVSAIEMLERHTTFGFYARTLDPRVERAMTSLLVDQLEYRGPEAEGRTLLLRAKPSMWWCPSCANKDIENHGFSIWWAIHQLPKLRICPKHHHKLVNVCVTCGINIHYARTFRLPSGRCRSCGGQPPFKSSPTSERPSIGEIEFANDCVLLFEGKLPGFRPQAWAHTVDSFVKDVGYGHAESAIKADIKNAWNRNGSAGPFEILGLGSEDISSELRGWISPLQPYSRLVILGALRRMGRLFDGQCLIATPENCVGHRHIPDVFVDNLKDVLFGLGFPAGTAALLVSATSLESIKKKLALPKISFTNMIKGIPASLRVEIDIRREQDFLKKTEEGRHMGSNLNVSRLGLAIKWPI